MDRTVEVDLGGGQDTLVITIRGKPCRIQDAQDMIAALLRQMLRNQPIDATTVTAPCGCEEQK